MIHFGGPPLTIHRGYCGAPAEVLSGNLDGSRPDTGPQVNCPACLGKSAKHDREAARWED